MPLCFSRISLSQISETNIANSKYGAQISLSHLPYNGGSENVGKKLKNFRYCQGWVAHMWLF